MSHTPRTDEVLESYGAARGIMLGKLAKELERELNAAKAENEAMRDVIKAAHKSLFYVSPVFGRTPAQDAVLVKLQPFLK